MLENSIKMDYIIYQHIDNSGIQDYSGILQEFIRERHFIFLPLNTPFHNAITSIITLMHKTHERACLIQMISRKPIHHEIPACNIVLEKAYIVRDGSI